MAEFAIGVCGFPRSGSSMTMTMWEAGGVPLVAGCSSRSKELANLDVVRTLPRADLLGRATKLLDAIVWPEIGVRDDLPWRFVWCSRDYRQQARSQVKFTEAIMQIPMRPGAAAAFEESYRKDHPAAIDRLSAIGPVTRIGYEATLANPRQTARTLAEMVPEIRFDVDAAAAVVHRRDGRCRPDLAFEFGTGAFDPTTRRFTA